MSRGTRVRIIALGVIVLSTVILVELASRLAFPCYRQDECYWPMAMHRLLNSGVVFDPSENTYSKRFGYRLSPNAEKVFRTHEYRQTVHTNSLGFRTKEIATKEPGEQRVLLLGDSFFFGSGVERNDMIESHLERLSLSKDPKGFTVTAYTLAMTGYNTVQALIVAREFIEKLKPDVIVLGLFVGNDLLPNAVAFIDEKGNYAVSEEALSSLEAELRRSYPPLLRDSAAFRVLAYGLYTPRLRYRLASRKEHLEHTFRLLERLQKLAGAHGSSFSVVIIYPRDGIAGGLSQWWSNSREIGRTIRLFCERRNISVVDLLDHMEGDEDLTRFYYPIDGHFNPAGARRVAEAIYREIFPWPPGSLRKNAPISRGSFVGLERNHEPCHRLEKRVDERRSRATAQQHQSSKDENE